MEVLPEKGEDRISRLPDELIHEILSFIDPKDAVQTSLLSTRWNNVWKSLSHLNFDRYYSNGFYFSKFVEQFLVHRDHRSDLSVLNLNWKYYLHEGHSLVNKIAEYGALHNLQHLTISSDGGQFPPSVFTSQSLKHLSLTSNFFPASISSFILPALTTLLLKLVSFKSVNLFSNLLNLKYLTLIDCDTNDSEVFYIVSPQLENLHITSIYHEVLFFPCKFVISAPKLSSFKYKGRGPLLISANHLHYLDRVYMDILECPYNDELMQRVYWDIINMFYQLRDAKFVTLTEPTIYVLSTGLKLLEDQQSPFHKMERLKIETRVSTSLIDSSALTGVITYLCNSSPSCDVIDAYGSSLPGQ